VEEHPAEQKPKQDVKAEELRNKVLKEEEQETIGEAEDIEKLYAKWTEEFNQVLSAVGDRLPGNDVIHYFTSAEHGSCLSLSLAHFSGSTNSIRINNRKTHSIHRYEDDVRN